MAILQEESELEEIVRLVGVDALSSKDRLTMEAARSLREDYLHQNAFHEVDTYSSLKKQHGMLKIILDYYERGQAALTQDVEFSLLENLPVRETIGRLKYVPEEEIDASFKDAGEQLAKQIHDLMGGLEDA